jgi:hypothetical protein
MIKGSEDQPLKLTVYNCRDKIEREILLTPSRNWPGSGLLGAKIRFEGFLKNNFDTLKTIDFPGEN